MAVRCVIWNQALKTYRRGITIVVHACRRIYHFIRAVMSCSKVREVAYSEEQPVRVLSVRPISPVHSSRLRYSISIDNLPGSVGETDTRERILVERRQIGNRFCTPHRNRRPPNLPTLLALLQALEMYENPSEVREDSSSQEVKTVISENPGGDKYVHNLNINLT
ncbi:hypothetical protein C0J52_03155 [Blattella germanica]|nr:hypothetical protein C0J52_03155 [Blattella germanica]